MSNASEAAGPDDPDVGEIAEAVHTVLLLASVVQMQLEGGFDLPAPQRRSLRDDIDALGPQWARLRARGDRLSPSARQALETLSGHLDGLRRVLEDGMPQAGQVEALSIALDAVDELWRHDRLV